MKMERELGLQQEPNYENKYNIIYKMTNTSKLRELESNSETGHFF